MSVHLAMEPRSTPLHDGDLLRRHREGDFNAFDTLYHRYNRALYLYARTLTNDTAHSEDLVQEAFVRLMNYDPERLEDDAQAFLYAVVRNLLRDDLRRSAVRQRIPLFFVGRGSPTDSARLAQRAESISQALQQLPEEQRETVVLKIYSGMTFMQIATLTGTSIGTAASRYRYAIEKLGQLLADEQGGQ